MSAKIPLQQVPDDAVKHHDPFLPISRKKPQPRFVIGFFQHIRLISMYAVLALFVGQRILDGIDDLAFVHLTGSDVVRHRIVADIVDAYAQRGG
mgnify:CR=1 FL=1